jgi:hypothetical protein
VFTHLKGAVRELGKPIIVVSRLGSWEKEEREEFKKGGRFLIYANEFAKGRPEGFVGKIS